MSNQLYTIDQIRGLLTPLRQRVSERWSQTDGYLVDYEWQSFSDANLRRLASQLARNGWPYEMVSQNGKHTLVATDTTGNVTIDSWEIGITKLSLSIAKHPVVLGIIDRAGNRSDVVAGIKEALEGTAAYAAITNFASVYSADRTSLYTYLDAARNGEDSFYITNYTLRHTTNVSNRYDKNVADENVDTIYTTAQLLSEVQDANSWIYPLPERLAFKIQMIETDFVSIYGPAPLYHIWGWLKSGSAESSAANNRVNIVTEYEFGLINHLLYAAVP